MISHIGLTVSHLPTSCSFFLAALQPLGYKYIGQQGNQVGFGIRDEADFFLCQETPGIKAGAAHIAFSAPDRIAVRNFYTAALTAGARPHGSPATRDAENGVFNAAVLDFDGNSIEVMFKENVDPMDDSQSVGGFSRVLTWRKSVNGSVRDDESVISGSTVKTATRTVVPYQAPKSAGPGSVYAPSVKAESVAPSYTRTQSAPVVPRASKEELNPELMADAGARKIIGTLIGAAAGAAVAYAMVKSERDSAKEEAAAIAASQAGSQKAQSVREPSQKAPSVAPQSEFGGYTPSQVQQMIQYERAPSQRGFSETESMYSAPRQRMAIEAAPARSTHAPTLVSALQSGATTVRQAHRNFSETESMYSSADSRDRYSRALENAPQTIKNLNPTCVSVAQTSVSKRNDDVEYIPASSVGPRSTYSRKSSSPSVISEMPKSSRAPSQAPSKAPSQSPSKSGSKAPSLISSFRPDDDDDRKSHVSESRRSSAPSAHSSRSKADRLDSVDESAERRSSAGSMRSHHSSKSKAKSLISSFVAEDREDYPPTPPKSTAPSAVERRSSAASTHSTKSKASTVKPEGTKAPSLIGSILGRNKNSENDDDGPSDLDTVAPSDSISNAGSSRSSLRRGSRKEEDADGDDARSSHSRHSKHSKHSSSSRHSSKSKHRSGDDDGDKKSHVSSRSHKSSSSRRSERKEEEDVVRPSTISEPSEASTVKPYKPRKDSVVSLPTRKLEGSIVDGGKQRSVVSYAG
ncbi:putative glyoxalase family protein [Lasiodiplodia theobromae]|uniref:Glyoxalase family protein n=1 Tax=Lasiodiplodia theobromae TaxID=45133 RepID=UPI0015C2E1B9|nr:Glyoxalase family protein [Lasiodiplodia theobromae]KAF4545676.1 Glyoxalase family protein [Lasiodiplodia theobromae]KAF9636226.1 putative glyoxalase family protein [Lasiodiplodia theobromae]